MNEATALKIRDRVGKRLGLVPSKANLVMNEVSQGSFEIKVMCADETILRVCEKLIDGPVEGIPVKAVLRPQIGATPGLRLNTNHGRIVLRDK